MLSGYKGCFSQPLVAEGVLVGLAVLATVLIAASAAIKTYPMILWITL